MNPLRHLLLPLIAALIFSLVATIATVAQDAAATDKDAAAAKKADDATGTWKWDMPGPNGDVEITLTLKQEGEKLTGTLRGGFGGDSEIQDGTFKEGKATFKVVRDFGGTPITTTYTGTLSGDTFKGSSETVIKREFDAKRSK